MIAPDFTKTHSQTPKKREREESLDEETRLFYKAESLQNHIISGGYFFYQGEDYKVSPYGEGNFQDVFSFDEDKSFKVGEKTLRTRNIVLKTYKSDPKKRKFTQKNDISAYQILRDKGIPLPMIYATPKEEKDPFWIVEKMARPVTGDGWTHAKSIHELSEEDQKVLAFAKKFLTLNSEEYKNGTEYLGDFYPRNVMVNKSGDPVVVDPTLPAAGKETCLLNLIETVKAWSQDNSIVKGYLTEKFPKSLVKRL